MDEAPGAPAAPASASSDAGADPARAKAWIAFAVFFFLMAGYYCIKPVREAVFLHRKGFDRLPQYQALTAFGSLALAYAYGGLASVCSRRALLAACFGAWMAALVWFAGLLAQGDAWAAGNFYVGINLFILLLTSLSWSTAHDTFGTREGRRWYGLVALAGPLGALCGAGVAQRLAGRGVVNLLWVSLPFFAAALAMALCLDAAGRRRPPPDAPRVAAAGRLTDFTLVFKSSYVLLLAGLVASAIFALRLYDLDFSRLVAEHVQGENEKAEWAAQRFMWENGLGILLQLFLTPVLLRRYGPGAILWVLPALALSGGIALAGHETLTTAFGLMAAAGAVGYTMNQSARELLWVPCDRKIKFQAKAFVDLFCFRLGDAAAGVAVLAGQAVFSKTSYRPFLVLAAGVCVAWLGFALRLGARFREATEADASLPPPRSL